MEYEQIKLFLLDDDRHHRVAVEKIINEHFPEIVIAGSFGRINELTFGIQREVPDLFIISTEMKEKLSYDLLEILLQNGVALFITSINNAILSNLKLSGIPFVLKPFDVHEMVTEIDRTIELVQSRNQSKRNEIFLENENSKEKKIILNNNDEERVCLINEISYAEAIVGGSVFHFADQSTFFVPQPLRRFDSMLQPFQFMRCHPYYIVNLKMVLDPEDDAKELHLQNTCMVPVEERKLAGIKSELYDLKHQQMLYKLGIN